MWVVEKGRSSRLRSDASDKRQPIMMNLIVEGQLGDERTMTYQVYRSGHFWQLHSSHSLRGRFASAIMGRIELSLLLSQLTLCSKFLKLTCSLVMVLHLLSRGMSRVC